MTNIQPGNILHDAHSGRWLRVDTITTRSAICTVIAKTAGSGRTTAPGNQTQLSLERIAPLLRNGQLVRVDTAPAPTGPDYREIGIDHKDQSIVLDGGTPIRYHVNSSGPRIKHIGDGTAQITITLTTTAIREVEIAPTGTTADNDGA